MDFNDISSRLKRIHSSVGERFDDDVVKHIKVTDEPHEGRRQVKVSFDGSGDENDILNKIFYIMGNIANLKDPLIKKNISKGGTAQDIESEINSSIHLQIALDLYNQEKHGYPLDKFKRSDRDPKLINISRALSVIADGKTRSSSFTFNPFTGEMVSKGNTTIVITADVVDGGSNKIFNLDELINESVKKWEEVIQKYNLQ